MLQAKTAKLLVEALRVIHDGENAAWGVDDAAPVDLDAISDEALEDAIEAASLRIAQQRRDGGATLH